MAILKIFVFYFAKKKQLRATDVWFKDMLEIDCNYSILFAESKDTTENVCLESSPKKTCRIIIITNFLLSFSIYLVSLRLYTRFVYKILFKRHLISAVNINTMFFITTQP